MEVWFTLFLRSYVTTGHTRVWPRLARGRVRGPSRRELKQVEQLVRVHRGERRILLVDDRGGHVPFERLCAHDLLLERVARHEPVYVDDAPLPNTVRTVHRLRTTQWHIQRHSEALRGTRKGGLERASTYLQVLHRVPVVVEEDDHVGTR